MCDADHALPGRQISEDGLIYRYSRWGWPKALDRKILKMAIYMDADKVETLSNLAHAVSRLASAISALTVKDCVIGHERRVRIFEGLGFVFDLAGAVDGMVWRRGDVSKDLSILIEISSNARAALSPCDEGSCEHEILKMCKTLLTAVSDSLADPIA